MMETNILSANDLKVFEKSLNQFHSHFPALFPQRLNLVSLAATNDVSIPTDLATANNEPEPTPPPRKTLNDLLESAITVPSTSSVVEIPKSKMEGEIPSQDILKMLDQIRTMESFMSVLTAYCIYNDHPEPYDRASNEDTTLFAIANAKWRSYVATGGAVKSIAAYLPAKTITSQAFNKTMDPSEVHFEFLKEIFGAFDLRASDLKELDKILTSVSESLKSIQLTYEAKQQTLDHFLTYYHFVQVEGTGGDTGLPKLYSLRVKTMNIHLDTTSWKQSVGGKNDRRDVGQIDFKMNYFHMETELNSGLVAEHSKIINDQIKSLTDKSTAEIAKLISPSVVVNSNK